MNKQKIHKTVVFTGYDCNNRCRFCMEADKRIIESESTAYIKKEMTEARNRGSDYIELIGGEVTIRKDFLDLIIFAKKLRFKTIMIATNGRMLSYKKLAREALLTGLNSIVFSIHGHNEEIHDHLTRSQGSFSQLRKGLENVRNTIKEFNLKVNVGSNTCIVKQNYKYLPEIGKFIADQGINNSEFIFVDCNEGGAFNDFYNFVPKISECASYIRKCLDIGKRERFPHWHIRYVPLCYFTEYLDQISEMQERETFHTNHIAPDFKNFNVFESREKMGRKKGKQCKDCVLNDKCEGIWTVYAEKYGTDELSPII